MLFLQGERFQSIEVVYRGREIQLKLTENVNSIAQGSGR